MVTGNTASGTFYVFNKKEQSIPVVFIHGVGLTYEIWQPQLDFFKNYSNLSYDILGHGKSTLTKQNINFDDFSEQLIELINELKIEKIHLVGFSIGSLIARNFATRYSERLQSLILLGSIYKRSEQQQKIVNERFEQAKKELKLSSQALKRWFSDKYLENNPDTYEKISSILSANNMANFLKVYELFVRHQNDEDFEKIYCKTLVMTGENDVGSTIEMSQQLKDLINNSELKIIKDGKHLCGIECADDVNLAIKNFVDKNE
jgi:pimeloyl-ACP methyl ester carboxylesterase